MIRSLPLLYKAVLAVAVAGLIVASGAAIWAGHRERQTAARVEEARRERVAQLNMINQAQCDSLSNIYGLLRKTVSEGDSRIDKIQYYREHPAERAAVHAANQAILSRFKTPPCPERISIQ